MERTAEQQAAIALSDRSILVSAAAGAGKTTVLVERVLRKILDETRPVDVHHLLIVTFTKAAAKEMRNRLYQRLREEAEAHPDNMRVRRQLALVFQAEICTIHSFCTRLLRNHFHAIDLDPAFRVGDEAEIKLLKEDALKEVLEEAYQEGRPEFIDFIEGFGSKTDDSQSESVILKLYEFSRSAPDPDAWLSMAAENYLVETPEALYETPWFRFFFADFRKTVESMAKGMEDELAMIRATDGPHRVYESLWEKELKELQRIAGHTAFDGFQKAIAETLFGVDRAPAISSKTPGQEFANLCKKHRDTRKNVLKKWLKTYNTPAEKMIGDLHLAAPSVQELVRLTKAMAERFETMKRQKNLVDFSDLEHLSIRILYENDVPSKIAEELRRQYDEIMVDEYQDSNDVQEYILRAVSGEDAGRPNYFMVGDMKQSIYRFRMARPELFAEKYRTFSAASSDHQKIELLQNFRSSRPVIDSVNTVFGKIMREDIGGIEYTAETALVHGRKETEQAEVLAGTTRLLLLDTGLSEEEDRKSMEWEARMIAREIKALMTPKQRLTVPGEQGGRPLSYGDIAVISRSMKENALIFREVFSAAGIPLYVEQDRGFYETWEIRLVLDLLKVIDNPVNDIPLAAVMRSPLFGFSSEELSRISGTRGLKEANGFFGAVKYFKNRQTDGSGQNNGARQTDPADSGMKNGVRRTDPDDSALAEKIRRLFEKIEEYRSRSGVMELSDFLRWLYEEAGITAFAAAMAGGARRLSNLEALIAKAKAYEETSYRGVFNFIRYIEKKKEHEIEEGEVGTAADGEDAVQLMTIHKSKGLEFPVVFIAGTEKQFNTQDERSSVLFHGDFGIGMRHVDHRRRTRGETILKTVIGTKNQVDALGEEMRILYVAMTRAKERLYLLGARKGLRETADQLDALIKAADGQAGIRYHEKLDYDTIKKGKSYLDWIRDALLAAGEEGALPFQVELVSDTDFTETAVKELEEIRKTNEQLVSGIRHSVDGEAGKVRDEYRKVLSYSYRYDDLSTVRATVSVSLLKALAYGSAEGEEEPEAVINDIPKPGEAVTGTAKGTLYHEVMERMEPGEAIGPKLLQWEKEGLISTAEKDTIEPERIEHFWASPLGQRFLAVYKETAAGEGAGETMPAAEKLPTGKTRLAGREKQFIIGIPVNEVFPEKKILRNPDELIMLQGVIDMFFEEEDGLVLVDYKTDRVSREENLKSRYQLQLDLYARALHQITGKPVKEKWIYSFALERGIRL